MATVNYSAVWRPGAGAQWWVSGVSFDSFKEKDTDHLIMVSD